MGALGSILGVWRVHNEFIPALKQASVSTDVKEVEENRAKVAGSEWLKQGVWLANARPIQSNLTADLQFSPDGLLVTGGNSVARTNQAGLWDVRTGKIKAKYGVYSYGQLYKKYRRVHFLSNQKILWAGTHDIAMFDRDGIIRDHVTDASTYNWLNTSPPTKNGLWIYSRGLYAQDKISPPSELDKKLRFLNFESKKISRVLPKSLTGPVSYAGMELNAEATLKTNDSQLAVLMECVKVFVLDENDKVVWSEAVGCLTDEGANLTNHTIVDDFQLTSDNRLLLLDRNKGLRQINLKTGKEARPYPLPERATKLAVSKSGNLWAFGDKSGRLMLVDSNKRELLTSVILPFTTEYLTFSPDEKSIVVGGLVILPIPNSTTLTR